MDGVAMRSLPSAGLKRLLLVEGITSLGSNFLTLGIFFYTEHHFRWSLLNNFALAAGLGLVYVIGSLLSERLARRFGRERLVSVLYALMSLCSVGAAVAGTPLAVVGLLLTYSFLVSMNWPALESLVSSNTDPHELSRRIGVYNLVWSGTGALALAVNGSLIEFWPSGVFLVPALVHGASAVLMWGRHTPVAAGAGGHEPPPAEVVRQRTEALWLSRITLPATYVVIYSLMAIMASLPLMKELDPSLRTPVGSLWMASRWMTFWVLGATVFWHTRPRLLLGAAFAMLGAFLAAGFAPGLLVMIVAQIALGVAIGMIYSASLYFGMVLSDGSTEHGGYHEALIGLGSLLGPGVGAISQVIAPGSVSSVLSVGAVIAASALAAAWADVLARRRAQARS